MRNKHKLPIRSPGHQSEFLLIGGEVNSIDRSIQHRTGKNKIELVRLRLALQPKLNSFIETGRCQKTIVSQVGPTDPPDGVFVSFISKCAYAFSLWKEALNSLFLSVTFQMYRDPSMVQRANLVPVMSYCASSWLLLQSRTLFACSSSKFRSFFINLLFSIIGASLKAGFFLKDF